MACPTMSFTGVTRTVYDRLVRQAAGMGLPAPQGPSGRVAYHNVEAEYRWDEGEELLELTITRGPEWLSCAMVESGVQQAIREASSAE